ncbi:hypothetical protein Ancab_018250 [Ancistrocladus abbreviatus]
MKINKNKGKVHPSPSSSVSSSSTTKDSISALRLLPAAILALISELSLEDKEVLAYMIPRPSRPLQICPLFSKETLGSAEKVRSSRRLRTNRLFSAADASTATLATGFAGTRLPTASSFIKPLRPSRST